jgi:hypothetical protein
VALYGKGWSGAAIARQLGVNRSSVNRLLRRQGIERPRPTDEQRFLAMTRRIPGGCLLWIGAKVGDSGYGLFWYEGRLVRAHRWAYQHWVGPIPNDHDIDHDTTRGCSGQPACVDPVHLEAVPPRVNWERSQGPSARAARKTHCAQGHPLSGDNLIPVPSHPTWRRCRICFYDRQRRYRKGTQP